MGQMVCMLRDIANSYQKAKHSRADVLVDGISAGAVGTYKFTNVTTPHTISATFELN
jgi:hypothetical protein